MAEARKQLNRRWLWLSVAIILIAVFFMVRTLTLQRLPVHVATAAHEPLASTVSTNGRVEPEENFPFYSPLATTVKTILVQPGDKVKAGQLLMELDDVEARARVAGAESAVKSAQATLDAVTHNGTQEQRQAAAANVKRLQLDRDEASRNLAALTKLQATGAASASEVAAARQTLAAAENALQASEQSAHDRYSSDEIARDRAALTDAEAGLTAARAVEAETAIHAPIAGTVYSVNVGRKDFVQQGTLLLQMADLGRERVRAYFDEPEIGRLAVGEPILIKWDAKPEQLWHGQIERVPVTVITYGTRTVGEVLVKIDSNDAGLLPDTNVTVTVTTASESNVLSIPREALYSENGKNYVFTVVDGSLKRTPVKIGTFNLTQVSIGSGLREGDVVATGSTTGQPLLEGVQIKVVP